MAWREQVISRACNGLYRPYKTAYNPTFSAFPVHNKSRPTFARGIVPFRGSGNGTYTRASTKYQIDHEGKHNLLLSGEEGEQGARRVRNLIAGASEDMTNGSWGSQGSPTITATRYTANGQWDVRRQTITTVQGNLYRLRYKAKSVSGSTSVLLYHGASATADYTTITLTSTYRVYSTIVLGKTGGGNVGFGIGYSGTSNFPTVDVTEFMVEDVTGQANQNPSEYVSVGVLSAPFHGANVDGVKYFDTLNGNTVASNVVTEATGAKIVTGASGVAATAPVDASGPFGYLAEGARADVLGATAAIRRTMADAGWTVGATMTVGSATGTDGVASAAASLTGGAVTATNTILFTTVLGSAARTYSAWIRRKTGTGTIEMTDNGGTNWTDITSSLTTTYKLFQVTRTQANPVVGFRITTNLDAIEVDFNTIEAATFANPTPIPVNVSKAADVLTYPSAGNANAAQGTMYAEVTTFIPTASIAGQNYAPAIVSDGTLNNYVQLGQTIGNSRLFIASGGATQADLYIGALAYGVPYRTAASWQSNYAILAKDGSLSSPDTTVTIPSSFTQINIGSRFDASSWIFGTIRNVDIFRTKRTPAYLVNRTSASCKWRLSA